MLNDINKTIKLMLLTLVFTPLLLSCDNNKDTSNGEKVSQQEESNSTKIKQLIPPDLKEGYSWEYNIESAQEFEKVEAIITQVEENAIGNKKIDVKFQDKKGNEVLYPITISITDSEVRTSIGIIAQPGALQYIFKDFQKKSNYSYSESVKNTKIVEVDINKQKVIVPAGEFKGVRYDFFNSYKDSKEKKVNSDRFIAKETIVLINNIGLAYYRGNIKGDTLEITLQDYDFNDKNDN